VGFLYFDDSNHPNRGFSVGTFVFAPDDPTVVIGEALSKHGFRPGLDEFKSSAIMSNGSHAAALRNELRRIIRQKCRLAVVVATRRAELGPEALHLLTKMAKHDSLRLEIHDVYFDQGLFSSVSQGDREVQRRGGLEQFRFHFEQNSTRVVGIQLADLASHTCAIMLAQELGFVSKQVRVGDNSGYDPEMLIDIGFELWAEIRCNFLCCPPFREVTELDDPRYLTADVRPYGLHIAKSATEILQGAADRRFGSTFFGCIH
jgi:hypothetical protein